MLDQPIEPAEKYRLTGLEYVVSDAVAPPSQQTSWQPLDGFVEVADQDPFVSFWVRVPVRDLLQVNRVNLLYLEATFANIEIWLAGELRYRAGPHTIPLPYIRSPLLIPLGQFGSEVPDWAYARVTKEWGFLQPGPAYLGPPEALRPAYERRLLMHRTLPSATLAVTLAIIVLASTHYLLRQRDGATGWYVLTLLLWAAHAAHPLVDYPPVTINLWLALSYAALCWVALMVVFLNRLLGFRMPRVERALLWVCALLVAAMIVLAASGQSSTTWLLVQWAWLPFIMLAALMVFGQCLVAIRNRWSLTNAGLLVISCVLVTFGIRDYLFEYRLVPGSTYYLQFVVLLLLLFFGVVLLRQHARALRHLRLFNVELKDRVAKKAAELERTFRQLTEIEKRREVIEERARLMRDVHDGLGMHLIHALSLAETSEDDSELKVALRDAINDLRLIVDCLAPAEDGLAALLANFRHRASRAVRQAGIAMEWSIAELDQVRLGPDRSLALLRIVQEATTNALRHAKCTHLWVDITVDDTKLTASIQDNGQGFAATSRKRGLNHMQIRADGIGATLSVDSDSEGTRVLCRVPLDGKN